MRVMTIFGTRPEIIRLSVIIKQLDKFCEHIVVHTGQNYDENLSDIFFRELNLRLPDVHLGIKATNFADQLGQILIRTSEVIDRLKPDRLLILGDTNSGLSSIVAARRGIPVFHLEAGNRCYDDRVPEEINRRIIDHCSAVLMPYTHRAKENLLREGIERDRIFVVGNPIYEVINSYEDRIHNSRILHNFKLEPQKYFVVTMHRAENVDNPVRLARLLEGLSLIGERYQLPIIVSLHPHTADKIQSFGLSNQSEYIKFYTPLGFFDFIALERNALCVITDSGTVQEECCILRIPSVTIRDVTERPETIECGSNMLTGVQPQRIVNAVEVVLGSSKDWRHPTEYMEQKVSTTVTKIVLGYHHFRRVGVEASNLNLSSQVEEGRHE
ncbi:MAG: UDP-N-acetylglucosamine 2-epimerase (non-hydrolyzing) [Halobacteria archaeon]